MKSNFNTEDSKELPEIDQNNYSNYYSGNNSSTNYLSKSFTNYGFMNKLNKKEIMLKYLKKNKLKNLFINIFTKFKNNFIPKKQILKS